MSSSCSSSRRRSRESQQMSMCKEQGMVGLRRRSPRISALDACKSQTMKRVVDQPLALSSPPLVQEAMELDLASCSTHHGHGHGHGQAQGPATRTRRKKRKLRPLEDVTITSTVSSADPKPKLKQSGKQLCPQHHTTDNDDMHEKDSPKHQDQQAIVPYESGMPEKRILELIIDVLQRKDTHEIFAEPVDPEEVEDYYRIIEEPMDFGTMRAKLHEGMYTSLQQFEHDVFLISKNAMRFNSSTTVFFKQAHAIHELAKKVFQALKSDPHNFESEFSETRQRACRRVQGGTNGLSPSSCPKLATNTRSRHLVIGVAAKAPPGLRRLSNIRRRVQVNPRSSTTRASNDAREVLSGTEDGRKSDSTEVYRRCTYKPWETFLDENLSVVSTLTLNPKQLIHVNGDNIDYRESLMLFVKDLGPKVQMIAKRKLQALSTDHTPSWKTPIPNYWRAEASNCQTSAASTSIQHGPRVDTPITAPISQNLLDYFHHCPSVHETSRDRDKDNIKNNQNCIPGAFGGEVVRSDHGTNILGVSGGESVHQNRSRRSEVQLGSHFSISGARDVNSSASGSRNTNKSTAMILDKGKLDNDQSNVSECRFGEGHKFSSSSLSTGVSWFGHSAKGSVRNVSSQSQCLLGKGQEIAAQVHGASEQPMPQSSKFIFDLPFLRTRLEQINSNGQDRFSEQGSSRSCYERTLTCTRQAERSTQPYNIIDHQQLDNQHNHDLALQL